MLEQEDQVFVFLTKIIIFALNLPNRENFNLLI